MILGLFDTSFGFIWRYALQNLVFKMTMLEAFVISQVGKVREGGGFYEHVVFVLFCLLLTLDFPLDRAQELLKVVVAGLSSPSLR